MNQGTFDLIARKRHGQEPGVWLREIYFGLTRKRTSVGQKTAAVWGLIAALDMVVCLLARHRAYMGTELTVRLRGLARHGVSEGPREAMLQVFYPSAQLFWAQSRGSLMKSSDSLMTDDEVAVNTARLIQMAARAVVAVIDGG